MSERRDGAAEQQGNDHPSQSASQPVSARPLRGDRIREDHGSGSTWLRWTPSVMPIDRFRRRTSIWSTRRPELGLR